MSITEREREITRRRKEINMYLEEYWFLGYLADVAETFVTEISDDENVPSQLWVAEKKEDLACLMDCKPRTFYKYLKRMIEKGFIVKHPENRRFIGLSRDVWDWVNCWSDEKPKNNQQ